MHTQLCSRSALLVMVSWMVASSAIAQDSTRQFQGAVDTGSVLKLRTSDGTYLIKPYNDKIIETTFLPDGDPRQPDSHAVVLQPLAVHTRFTEDAATLVYATPGISVTVSKQPFKISYSYRGKYLTSEKDGYVRDQRGETISFNLDSSEALYGAGARALGMDRRGNRLPLYNKAHYGYEDHSTQMNFSIPLIFSSKLYGIHFDNAPIGFLDLDSRHNNTLTYETISGRKTYQVIAADSWPDLVAAYTDLTGRQPLIPRWALGNFASRFGYHSAKEARSIVDQFAANQIPLDAIIFDLYWFGKEIKGTMGNLEFDADNFPEPEKMIKQFADQGIKTILITEPFILTSSKKWDEAVQKKILATDKNGQPFTYEFYFGHTGLIDIFDPAGETWFWNIYKKYAGMGVAGWWGDLGEPEVHPSDLQHKTGSADQVHNIYGHNWARLIADGYKKDFPLQRPFILMRSGYSGSQRFGMIPWSGDVNRTWGGLQSQPEIALQMGMQGLGYMHSDLGGFAGANLDNELYARWLQYGVFQPIFRPHAQEEVAAEPVLRDAPTMQLAKTAIELRYRMLPYNYTLAFENARLGQPLMRPLFFEEPQNRALAGVSDSYLWGHEFLVKPILHAGVKDIPVYFPAHANWFDFYSDQRYQAGSTQTVAVVPDHIPVFVRGGAFVPLIALIQNTEKYSTKNLDLHFYADPAVPVSSGQLYDDDGKTPDAFQKGEYALLQFHSTMRHAQLVISVDTKNGVHYQASDRSITFHIHNLSEKPKQVLLDGRQPVNVQWDDEKHILAVTASVDKSLPARLTISLTAR
ncbi:oligosaccharide 4-alpha-D-glucosyltransferase [Oxalobacteraceae bacterium GrIS 2.11]